MPQRDDAKDISTSVMLGVLSSIERDSGVTQRHLAQELGIAVGLTNAYIKRCAKKGFIKIRQVPLNRYAYYLTPRGFAEKSRLTAEYLTSSFDFFRRARLDAVTLLSSCHARGWNRAVLWGAGDLAEIMVLSAGEAQVEIACVVDETLAGTACAGQPVAADLVAALKLAGTIDVIVVTDTHDAQGSFDAAVGAARRLNIAAERIVAPNTLRLSPAAAKAVQ